MDEFTKQPYEEFVISADFTANFEAGTIISSEVVTAYDKGGRDVSDEVIDQASVSNVDGVVKMMVRSGQVELSPYKITVRTIDSVNNRWELDISMVIQEV